MKYSNPTLKRSSLMCHWFLIPLLSCWSQTDLMLLTFQLCKQQSNTECVPSFVFPTWLVFTVFIYLLPLNPFQGRSRANPGSRGLRAGHSLHPGPQPITLTFIFMADSKWTDLFFPCVFINCGARQAQYPLVSTVGLVFTVCLGC